MNREEIELFVSALDNTEADNPFRGDSTSLVFRHADTKKWFGLLLSVPKRYFGEGPGSEICLNVKCPPELSAMLRASYAGILPAYHMNKDNWITVRLGGSVPEEEIRNVLLLSRALTARRK